MAAISKSIGWTVILTFLAVVIAVASVDQPWWRVERTTSSAVYTEPFHVDGLLFYDDYAMTYGPYSYGSNYVYSASSSLHSLFASLIALSFIWAFFGILFIAFSLFERRLLSLVMGGVALAVGALAPILFFFEIADAASHLGNPIIEELNGDISFVGTHDSSLTFGDVVYNRHYSFGPSSGFYLLVLAVIMQAIAYVLRSLAVLRTPKEEEVKLNVVSDSPPDT